MVSEAYVENCSDGSYMALCAVCGDEDRTPKSGRMSVYKVRVGQQMR